jgi:hypothetical protein
MMVRLLSLSCVALLAGCGEPPAFVTSLRVQVVQLEACKSVASRPEQCVQAESVIDRRITLQEDQDQRAWIHGVRVDGVDDRSMYGSVASDGGWLFFSTNTEENSTTGCTIVRDKTLSLALPDKVTKEQANTDECVGLVGREIDQVSFTAGCDLQNDPPLAEVRTEVRRWQPLTPELCPGT